MSACLKKALESIDPELQNVHYKQYKSQVYADKIGLCMLDPASKDIKRSEFWWNKEGLAELKLDQEAILDKVFALLHRPEENIQWSL